jgi:hypothetical protein
MNAAAIHSSEFAPGGAELVSVAAARGIAALRAWFATWRLGARERYLGAADDHADLERRLRCWDQHEHCRAQTALLFL